MATGLAAGRQTVSWDGRDRGGNTVADGAYTFEVQAEGSGKEAVAATTYTRGTVSGVSFQDGVTYLAVRQPPGRHRRRRAGHAADGRHHSTRISSSPHSGGVIP